MNAVATDPISGVSTRLTILYDERCAVCRRARDWLLTQPCLVPVELLAAGSAEAQRRYRGLPWLGGAGRGRRTRERVDRPGGVPREYVGNGAIPAVGLHVLASEIRAVRRGLLPLGFRSSWTVERADVGRRSGLHMV